MELVAPVTLLYCVWPQWNTMVALFVLHYTNRALVLPWLNPPRAPLHVSVVGSAVVFNAMNAYLLGSWLRGRGEPVPATPWTHAAYCGGLFVFAWGLAGNVYHDHLLLRLRKRAQTGPRVGTEAGAYRIPYGGLYEWISYPNYVCECTSVYLCRD